MSEQNVAPEPSKNESGAACGSKACGSLCGWGFLILLALAVFGLGLLFVSIMERRQEAMRRPQLTEIGKFETDAKKWSVNWPREYSSVRKQQDSTTETLFGGAYPRDYLEATPNLVVLFAGYGFAKDYDQARGHVHAVEDVTHTKRVGAKTPATCWTCKSPDVPRLMAEYGMEKLGPGSEKEDLQTLVLAGAEDFYAKNFHDLTDEITHPIGCLDCHDPETMRLRISRPALIEAFERQGRDINAVSHQEMRSLVCAQCHVEYYFQGDGKYLTFPWDNGMSVEAMEEYYDATGFTDWTHAISKTPIIKMQHPDYEVYMTGVHSYRDVACADCHMPYRTEGGVKFTDHHVQSPLLNIANSCSVCHRWGEEELRSRVEGIQTKVREARDTAEGAVVKAHFDIAACMEAGADDEELAPVRELVRAAQVRWDYVAANNGMGFHSPQECMRILGDATDLAQESRIASSRILAKHGHVDPIEYPDVSTKEKAQSLIQRFIDGDPPTLL